MQAITSEALNKIEGVEAKCINIKSHKYNSDNDSVIYLSKESFRRSSPVTSFLRYLRYRNKIREWIKWADVLHYVWGPALDNGWDLEMARKLNKPIFIEWVGSDIRDPAFLSGINSYYRDVLSDGYEYKDIELSNYKERVQLLFAKAGAMPTLSPEMSLFLNRKIFPEYLEYPQRINVNQYQPLYPDKNNVRPHIVHSPTAKVGKGSNVIVKVIEELKAQYDFDFSLIHDLSREEALEAVRNADIFIDQIILGGYGMASCEAMAFGKPVVCYILPEVFKAGLPEDCPVINANADNLKEQLIRVIIDPVLRNVIGRKCRSFIERYSDANIIAKKFVDAYRTAVERAHV